MLESARDPLNMPWWSAESSIEASPRRNSSFGRVNRSLSRLNVEPDDQRSDLDLTLEGARKKLTWHSREEHRTSARNSIANDRPSIQNGSVHGRSAKFVVPDSPGRGIYSPPESQALPSGSGSGRSARFAVPDSPGRGIYNPPESQALTSGSGSGRSARFAVPDSPGRGIYNPPESQALTSGSGSGRSARFAVPDSPGRGIYNAPESQALPSGSGSGRSARFAVPDSPGRGIYNAPESQALPSGSGSGRSARVAVPDSPGRGIYNPPESQALPSGSGSGRSARFAVPDSPGRGIYNPPESQALTSGSGSGRSARFAVPDSPGRGIYIPPESQALTSGSGSGRSARFAVPDSPGRGIYNPPESPALQNGSANGRSARFGGLESPGRRNYNHLESSALQSGSTNGRSARFGALKSPGRGNYNPPESQALQSGSANGRSARFGALESPGRGIYNPPESMALQSGSANGRSVRFGVLDSPGRGIYNAPESPARRGESVRRVRTPSMDMTEVPTCATPSRRLRFASSLPRSAAKEGSGGAKSDCNVVREANSIPRVSPSTPTRDQRTAPKSRVQPTTANTAIFSSLLNSPERDEMVVSYLAEETDRLIKAQTRKLSLRSHQSNAAADQPRTSDREKSPAGEAKIANGGRRHASNSLRQIDKPNKAERVDTHDKHHHRVGWIERESDFHASRPGGTPSLPGSPLRPSIIGGEANGPTRTISATMENYLESRRKGSNMRPQIIVPNRSAGPPLPTASSHPNLAFLKQGNPLENTSTSSKIGVLGSRHDNLTASSRAALSPLNGNEDVSHSTTSLSQSKEENSEDPNRARRKDSNVDSLQVQGENGFPSRLQYWAEFLGKGEMDSSEGLRHLAQQTEERTSTSGRRQLGTKIASVRLHPNRAQGHSPQERKQIESYVRHPVVKAHSQRYEEVGRSLLSDKVLGDGARDKHSSSRRSQSCRRDSIVNSLLDSSQENETLPSASSRVVLPSGLDTSSDSKSSRRFSVDMQLSTSTDTIVESPVAVPESGENPMSNSGDPRFPTQTDKPKHQRTSSQAKVKGPRIDSSPVDSQLTETKKNAPQLERPEMSHKTSLSLDQDVYKKLFVETRDDNRSRPPVSTSTSVSQACSNNSPKLTKLRPPSPGNSLQRWIANHFRIGSKARDSSTAKFRDVQEEQKLETKSPWRTRPAGIFQGLTRKKGSSTSAPAAPSFDVHSLPNLRKGNLSEISSVTQSSVYGPNPRPPRMAYLEAGSRSTPPHLNPHLLPSIAAFSPAHPKGFQNPFKNRRPR